MPRVPAGVTSTPEVPGQPYDATSSAVIGKWKSVDGGSGPANSGGQAAGDFDSDGNWSQT